MEKTHHHETKKFPEEFLWGAATSAHQVEGNNRHNDWWDFEQRGLLKHKSRKACDHYNRFEEDFALAEQMHHNAHRLSIEWSRIEPEQGKWDHREIEHYRHVFDALKKRNMKIMVTLHHFTLPLWFARKGGFEKARNVKYFVRFVEMMAEQYADVVDFWITINEPGVYTLLGYEWGNWPPLVKSKKRSFKVYVNLVRAHRKTYKAIHKKTRSRGAETQVGIAQNVLSFATYRKHSLVDQLAVWLSVKFTNHGFYLISGKKTHDFLGINYYFRVRLRRKRGTLKIVHDDISRQGREVSDMGWEIYPHGLFDVLMDFRDFNKPIYITENGVATENDDKRQRFLVSHLHEVFHAINAGANIKGYFHWSLLDNFEWHDGFGPRFGLVAVNYKTFERTIKTSGKIYSQIIEENGLSHKMFRLLGHEAKL